MSSESKNDRRTHTHKQIKKKQKEDEEKRQEKKERKKEKKKNGKTDTSILQDENEIETLSVDENRL